MSEKEKLYLLSDIDKNTDVYKIFEDDINFFNSFLSLEKYSNIINDKEDVLKFIDGQMYKDFLKQFEIYLRKKENNYFTCYFQLIEFLFKIRPKLLPIIIFTIPTALKFYSSYKKDIKNYVFNERLKSDFYDFVVIPIIVRINNYSDIKTNKLVIIEHPENYLYNFIFKEIKDYQKGDIEELIPILYEDNYDNLISFLAKYPNINIDEKIMVYDYPFLYYCFQTWSVSLIGICCLFGAINCFKYFYINNCKCGRNINKYSIIGGNYEIVQILHQENIDFHDCLEIAIKYHQYSLTNWLLTNYDCDYKNISENDCVDVYNFQFLIFIHYNKFHCYSTVIHFLQLIMKLNVRIQLILKLY